MRVLALAASLLILTLNSSIAATVSCMFMTETSISKTGEWLEKEEDFMKLFEMFGDGLKLPLENSLLGNLDGGKPFVAGEVDRGTVYLMGGEDGISGKLINVEGDTITIFDGYCDVGFG